MKIKRLEKQLKSILQKDLKRYLESIGPLTGDENVELREWVRAGNSVSNNPYHICDESGWPMDFINGCRFGDEMCENLSNYNPEEATTLNDVSYTEEELPF